MSPPEVSVVVTVLNERKNIRDLLDSLVTQPVDSEIVVVDAGSGDGTQAILAEYAATYPQVKWFEERGKRGHGRNFGVAKASGRHVAFTDGDCIANPFWLEKLLAAHASGAPIVAGRTIQMGYWAFENLQRVELPHKGHDTTHPSCNLSYERALFARLGGFDPRFVTAEDIDLNFRALDQGATIAEREDAIIYHRARDSIKGFFRQAYWNGYGRKQLTLKHGALWSDYRFADMIRTQLSFWGLARIGSASLGYLMCKLKESKRDYEGPMPTVLAQPMGVRTKGEEG